MAQRIPRDESLSRVHGVGALFSAAYGNVGSSIYYALGVTAAFALGLTPVAFVISGLIFAATAATYAEATVMYPEAGGSSSFARHAFNELVSFVAAWGQMLNYTITVAISAFFVPHYLAVFWPWLGDSPGDIIGGAVLIVALALINIRGTEESAKLNLVLAVADLATQVILVGIGLVLVLSPEILVDNVHLGVAPTWSDFAARDRGRDDRLHRDRDDLQHGRGGQGRGPHDPPQRRPRPSLAVLGLYLLIPIVALSAMPVTQDAAGHYTTALGTTFADDPILGIVENLGLGPASTEILRYYVGVLAAVILLIATNAGLIGVSRLTYSMGQHRQLPEGLRQVHPQVPHALHRDPDLRRDRDRHPAAGPDRLPGDDVLVRGDALVHDRPRRGDPAAAQQTRRRADLEAAAERPRLRLRGADHRRARRPRHLRRLDRGDGAQPAHARRRRSAGWRSGSPSTSSTAATRGCR